LVELVLVIPLVMLLVAGTTTFAMAMFSKVALQSAAQEGATYGSYDPTHATEITNRVRGSSTKPVDLTNTSLVTVEIHYRPVDNIANACGNTGGTPNAVEVTVRYSFPVVLPYIAAIIGSPTIPLSATATDTILSPACP
jgi:hypothetical protein